MAPLYTYSHRQRENLSLEACNIAGEVKIVPGVEEQIYHFPIF